MNEYINKEKVMNLIEHNDKVQHYADKQYEDIVYKTTQQIILAVAEMPAADEYLSRDFVLSCVDNFLSKTNMPIAAQYFYDCFGKCDAETEKEDK